MGKDKLEASSDVFITPSDLNVLTERGLTLDKLVGEGSYAKVYKAIQVLDETRYVVCACKCINTIHTHRDYINKFLPRELDILIRLKHPHIINVTCIFQRRAKYFIFLRYAEKGDMLDFLTANGAIPENQARLWFRQIICGLQYIHAMNCAHRDLKCENVLITENYNVKITDFGFARIIKQRDREILSETYCGSLSYAAPEILKGVPYYPKCADMWSTGIILYTMLNKALPFNETSVKKLYEKQVLRKWRFRTGVVSDLSAECKEQVTLLMEPDSKLRLTAMEVMNGAWIGMDPRISKLTFLEQSLLKQAEQENLKTEEGDTNEIERLAEIRRKGRAKDGLKILKDIDKTAVISQPLVLDNNE